MKLMLATGSTFAFLLTLHGCGGGLSWDDLADDGSEEDHRSLAQNGAESPDDVGTPCDEKGTWSKKEISDGLVPKVPGKHRFKSQLNKLDVIEVIKDVRSVLKADHPCWPADWKDDPVGYGPLMVRLAWHCSGTYRNSDDRGGCGGGRIRFDPEARWPDNGNLDKARSFLAPIKNKYGDGLSWGDLIVLAGTLAIKDMGGPTDEFCFGRRDDGSARKSMMLDCDPDPPNNEGQRCAVLHPKGWPHGQDVAGNIYVDPQGPGGDPIPYLSAQDVERTFGRMGMSFRQTVALVGGGHAFGKAHGSSGEGGVKTSGFEGKWTRSPTKWDNEYFKALVEHDWEPHEIGEGDTKKIQWRTVDRESDFKDTMMLTADLALKAHPQYSVHAVEFSQDQEALDLAFANAWWTLTTNGGGWLKEVRRTNDGSWLKEVRRCVRLQDF